MLTATQPAKPGTTYKGEHYTHEQIAAMREWIDDCQWTDLELGEAQDLSDIAVLRGIEQHFDGGLADFLLCM